MCVYVVYDVNTEQISKTLGLFFLFVCFLFEAFSLQKLVFCPFPSITNQFSVDDLGLARNIATLAKE